MEKIIAMCNEDIGSIYKVYLPYRFSWNRITKEVYFFNGLRKPLGITEGRYNDPPMTSKQIDTFYLYDDDTAPDVSEVARMIYIAKVRKILTSMIEKGYTVRDDFIEIILVPPSGK